MYVLPMTTGVSNVVSRSFGPEPITGRLIYFELTLEAIVKTSVAGV
jgi:hypothetical protein